MNKFTILRLVFDFVLTIITCVLLFYLINTKISIVKIFSFILSVWLSIFPTYSVIFSFLFHVVILSFCLSWSISVFTPFVFIFSFILFLIFIQFYFYFHISISLSQSVSFAFCDFFCDSFSFSFSITLIHFMIWFDMIWYDLIWLMVYFDIVCDSIIFVYDSV